MSPWPGLYCICRKQKYSTENWLPSPGITSRWQLHPMHKPPGYMYLRIVCSVNSADLNTNSHCTSINCSRSPFYFIWILITRSFSTLGKEVLYFRMCLFENAIPFFIWAREAPSNIFGRQGDLHCGLGPHRELHSDWFIRGLVALITLV